MADVRITSLEMLMLEIEKLIQERRVETLASFDDSYRKITSLVEKFVSGQPHVPSVERNYLENGLREAYQKACEERDECRFKLHSYENEISGLKARNEELKKKIEERSKTRKLDIKMETAEPDSSEKELKEGDQAVLLKELAFLHQSNAEFLEKIRYLEALSKSHQKEREELTQCKLEIERVNRLLLVKEDEKMELQVKYDLNMRQSQKEITDLKKRNIELGNTIRELKIDLDMVHHEVSLRRKTSIVSEMDKTYDVDGTVGSDVPVIIVEAENARACGDVYQHNEKQFHIQENSELTEKKKLNTVDLDKGPDKPVSNSKKALKNTKVATMSHKREPNTPESSVGSINTEDTRVEEVVEKMPDVPKKNQENKPVRKTRKRIPKGGTKDENVGESKKSKRTMVEKDAENKTEVKRTETVSKVSERALRRKNK